MDTGCRGPAGAELTRSCSTQQRCSGARLRGGLALAVVRQHAVGGVLLHRVVALVQHLCGRSRRRRAAERGACSHGHAEQQAGGRAASAAGLCTQQAGRRRRSARQQGQLVEVGGPRVQHVEQDLRRQHQHVVGLRGGAHWQSAGREQNGRPVEGCPGGGRAQAEQRRAGPLSGGSSGGSNAAPAAPPASRAARWGCRRCGRPRGTLRWQSAGVPGTCLRVWTRGMHSGACGESSAGPARPPCKGSNQPSAALALTSLLRGESQRGRQEGHAGRGVAAQHVRRVFHGHRRLAAACEARGGAAGGV